MYDQVCDITALAHTYEVPRIEIKIFLNDIQLIWLEMNNQKWKTATRLSFAHYHIIF